MSTLALGRQDRSDGGIVLGVIAVCAVAWGLAANRMAGMDAGPTSELGGIGWFMLTWVMMAAMMLPAVAPMIVVYGRRARGRSALVAF